jgi:hypothetical protein
VLLQRLCLDAEAPAEKGPCGQRRPPSDSDQCDNQASTLLSRNGTVRQSNGHSSPMLVERTSMQRGSSDYTPNKGVWKSHHTPMPSVPATAELQLAPSTLGIPKTLPDRSNLPLAPSPFAAPRSPPADSATIAATPATRIAVATTERVRRLATTVYRRRVPEAHHCLPCQRVWQTDQTIAGAFWGHRAAHVTQSGRAIGFEQQFQKSGSGDLGPSRGLLLTGTYTALRRRRRNFRISDRYLGTFNCATLTSPANPSALRATADEAEIQSRARHDSGSLMRTIISNVARNGHRAS